MGRGSNVDAIAAPRAGKLLPILIRILGTPGTTCPRRHRPLADDEKSGEPECNSRLNLFKPSLQLWLQAIPVNPSRSDRFTKMAEDRLAQYPALVSLVLNGPRKVHQLVRG